MLNLHLMQKNIPILGQFNLPRTPHEHLQRPPWTEVGFEHGLETGGGGDVDGGGGAVGHYFGGGV